MQDKKQTGLTRDAGYQAGVRRTLNYPPDQVWNFLFSENGLAIWLAAQAPSTLSLIHI